MKHKMPRLMEDVKEQECRNCKHVQKTGKNTCEKCNRFTLEPKRED